MAAIGSAVGRLLGVFDSRRDADAAMHALAAFGIDASRIDVLEGADDAAAFDSRARRGILGRLFRIVEFTWADQAPDFAWYAAALRQGWVVVAVKVSGQDRISTAAGALSENGGHFLNHFGWFETQELSRWRGREPELPSFLRR